MDRKAAEDLSFEEALAGLEAAAGTLKQEGIPLAEALRSFEDGMAYHQRCQQILSETRQRILRYDRATDTAETF